MKLNRVLCLSFLIMLLSFSTAVSFSTNMPYRLGTVSDIQTYACAPSMLSKNINMPHAYNELSFRPIIADVRALYPDDKPMSDAIVVAINHEYYFRQSERTNASGWVTFKAMPGNWSFFVYPGRSIQKGIGYFPCILNKHLENPVEEVVLKPEVEVNIELLSSVDGLTDFDMTDVWVTENNFGFFGEVGMVGLTDQNNFTLFTQSNVTARVSLNKMAQPTQPGIIFVSEPILLEGYIRINLTNLSTAKLRLEFRGIDNNLASGAHVQFHVMERSWQWSPYIVDYPFGNLTFVTSLSNFWVFCGVDVLKDATRYRMLFNSKHLKPSNGEQIVLKFGGPLYSKVLITPKATVGFKPATQVMLYTTDASNNVVMEVWKFGADRLKPHLVITTDGGKKNETDMELAFASKILREFERSENPHYKITYDFGPFGNRTFEGDLYDSESDKMLVCETDQLIAQSPAIDYALRAAQVNYYETLFHSMEELMGVPTDYKIGVISNIMHAGFEDEILHGFKLEIPLEIGFPSTWPLGDDYIAHEMGHGRINKPPANYRLWEEPYATLVGYKARAYLFGDNRLFDFLMGSHDFFLRHQHGDPVQTGYDQIEMIQFITYYIEKNYGWEPHRSMILEWQNAFVPIRNVLSSNGFSEIEQMATIYSYLVGENIAWIFKLGSFDVTKDKVDAGINLIMQDQQQSGNIELKIGEAAAVTYTTSVPIMLRRCPSGLSKISMTLVFDHKSARILDVFRRDLTNNQKWNLTTISDAPGHMTIVLEGSKNITRLGSIAQVNFELIPTNRSELQITVLGVSTDSKRNVATEGGRIVMNQLSVVRPKELPFEVIWNESTYYVTMSSNSTIRNFHLDQASRTLLFNVTGPIGTLGFCNVTIPKQLLNASAEEWIVLVDNEPVDPIVTWNTTHTFLFFTYVHSTHKITIIPEFPSFLMLLFIITTLLTVIVYRRKRLTAYRR